MTNRPEIFLSRLFSVPSALRAECLKDLAIREPTCRSCSAGHHRDVNAAKKILAAGVCRPAAGTLNFRTGRKATHAMLRNQGRFASSLRRPTGSAARSTVATRWTGPVAFRFQRGHDGFRRASHARCLGHCIPYFSPFIMARAMTICCIWLVPSKMRNRRTSR